MGSTESFATISPFKMGRGGHGSREIAQWVKCFPQTGPEFGSPVPHLNACWWVAHEKLLGIWGTKWQATLDQPVSIMSKGEILPHK